MQDQPKTSDPLLDGIDALRARVDELAASVTRHRQLEEDLRESEALHRITLGSLSDAVFITDDTGGFTFICPNVNVIFGYAYDEVQAFGNIAHLLGEGLYVPAELDAVKELRNIERQITDASGHIHILLVNIKRVAIKDGTVLYTCRDITERKASEARMRSVVDTAVDGIITINEDGIIASFNAAAEGVFGYTAAEVIGQNVTMLMPTPYKHEHDEYLARYRQTGERRIIGNGREVEGQRKDGTTFPMDLAVGECSVAGQRIFTGIVRDITERKQLVERLQNALTKVLSGYLPICAQCKKIRDHANNWVQVENYVRARTEAEFTHSICPNCTQELYPEIFR